MALSKQLWLNYAPDLGIELLQCRDEGKDISSLQGRVKEILAMEPGDPAREVEAARFLDFTRGLPIRDGYPHVEPCDIDGIRRERPKTPKTPELLKPSGVLHVDFTDDGLFDRIYGAWLGRAAGCLLGKPVEGMRRAPLVEFNKTTGNYPITFYMSSAYPGELLARFGIDPRRPFINNVTHMPEDDDMNYTVMGLYIMERYGANFTSMDIGEAWLTALPILHTCTAERVAYKNLVNLVLPPESGEFRNVYREWIGAQIRADFFGYVTPGLPELGAELAYRDACVSHVKNGIYGEMFVAAMLSVAAICKDVEDIVRAGLAQIPAKSRLAEAVNEVFEWKRDGASWEDALSRVHDRWDERMPYDWCHVIPNAVLVVIGLLYGELDLERSIGIAVSGAFDTDCNGATVGSIVGMAHGARALPEKWINPLNDLLESGVCGFGLVKISDLARRSVAIARKVLAECCHRLEGASTEH